MENEHASGARGLCAVRIWGLASLCVIGFVAPARAQTRVSVFANPSEAEVQTKPPPFRPSLESRPRWAAGLEGYAGISLLSTPEREFAHGVAGGLARLRFWYIQAGGFIEGSDSLEGRWTAAGGFVGPFLPYRGWVDFDVGVGLARRTYSDENARYGAGGYSRATTALSLRAGVSGCSARRGIGARMGVAIVGSFDLSHPEVPWVYRSAEAAGGGVQSSGTTSIGGTAFALVLSVGLEGGPGPVD